MIFNSVKEMNRLRKEVNRLLKVTIETFSKLRFSGFKNFATRSVLGAPTHADIIEFQNFLL